MSQEKKENILSEKTFSALELAIQLHGRDARKGSNIPYLAHPLSVCAMVELDGGDEHEAIAALLHDVLEDKADQIDSEKIHRLFGRRVLKIIACSIDVPLDYRGGPKPPWKERKIAYLEHARKSDPSLLRVTIADKIDNSRAILADYKRIGDRVWKKFNAGKDEQLWYYRACFNAYQKAGCEGPLMDELGRLVDEMEKLAGVPDPIARRVVKFE